MTKQIKPIRLTITSDCGDLYEAIQYGSCRSILIGENEFVVTSVSRAGNSVRADFVQVSRRAPTWTGEGLPPVGTACEFKRKLPGAPWKAATILCVGEKRVFFRDKDGDELSRDHSEVEFRPIRTPEQIAAEERELAVAQMLVVGGQDPILFELACKYMAELLYDAGYRKPEIVDE